MTQPLTLETTRRILATALGIDPRRIAHDARLVEDLGADSLAMAEIALALTEHGYEVPDEHVREIRTLGDLLRVARPLATAVVGTA